jgi:hypothetical protein
MGFKLDSSPQELFSDCNIFPSAMFTENEGHRYTVDGIKGVERFFALPLSLRGINARLSGSRDLCCDGVLINKASSQFLRVASRPDMEADAAINQTNGQAHPITGSSQSANNQIAGAKFTGDWPRIIAITANVIVRNHVKRSAAGKSDRQIVCNPLCDASKLFVTIIGC